MTDEQRVQIGRRTDGRQCNFWLYDEQHNRMVAYCAAASKMNPEQPSVTVSSFIRSAINEKLGRGVPVEAGRG